MARHWPYQTTIKVVSGDTMRQILSWSQHQYGDTSYQHWTSIYSRPYLTVCFCDVDQKTQFDLTWVVFQE